MRLMNAKVLSLVIGLLAVLTLGAVFIHGAAPEPVQAAAAVDYFLKIDGIDGESTDKGHEDEIDVLAWSWGMSQSDTHTSDGTIVPDFQELELTKYVDKSTPKLMERLAGVAPLREAEIVVSNAAGEDYYIIHMTNVMVTSISTGGSGGEDRLTENVTLNFAEVKVKYTAQDSKGSGVEHIFIWNTNTEG